MYNYCPIDYVKNSHHQASPSKHHPKLLGIEDPSIQNNSRPSDAHDTSEDLDVKPALRRTLQDLPADRCHSERGNGDEEHDNAHPVAHLRRWGHGRRQSGEESDEGAGHEAEQDGEANDGGLVSSRNP